MALARLVTFVAGTLIKSADVNGEFNNILNNPVALISPSTGAINFNLQAHTNLLPSAITASSATVGQVLTVSAASTTAQWVNPVVTTSGTRVLQMVAANAAGPVNAASTTMTDAGVSIAITPASTASRIAIQYSYFAIAGNLTGVNNTYVAQLASSTGVIPLSSMQVAAISGAGGQGANGTIAWNVVPAQTTAAAPITYKIQHMVTATSQVGTNGSLNNFNGMLTEYSS